MLGGRRYGQSRGRTGGGDTQHDGSFAASPAVHVFLSRSSSSQQQQQQQQASSAARANAAAADEVGAQLSGLRDQMRAALSGILAPLPLGSRAGASAWAAGASSDFAGSHGGGGSGEYSRGGDFSPPPVDRRAPVRTADDVFRELDRDAGGERLKYGGGGSATPAPGVGARPLGARRASEQLRSALRDVSMSDTSAAVLADARSRDGGGGGLGASAHAPPLPVDDWRTSTTFDAAGEGRARGSDSDAHAARASFLEEGSSLRSAGRSTSVGTVARRAAGAGSTGTEWYQKGYWQQKYLPAGGGAADG